jgi:LysM domain
MAARVRGAITRLAATAACAAVAVFVLATPAVAGDADSRPYRVRAHDTVWRIAHRCHTTVAAVEAVNGPGFNRDVIHEGEEIRLPASATWTVARGDTVDGVAACTGRSRAQVVAWNRWLRERTRPTSYGQTIIIIRPGERLRTVPPTAPDHPRRVRPERQEKGPAPAAPPTAPAPYEPPPGGPTWLLAALVVALAATVVAWPRRVVAIGGRLLAVGAPLAAGGYHVVRLVGLPTTTCFRAAGIVIPTWSNASGRGVIAVLASAGLMAAVLLVAGTGAMGENRPPRDAALCIVLGACALGCEQGLDPASEWVPVAHYAGWGWVAAGLVLYARSLAHRYAAIRRNRRLAKAASLLAALATVGFLVNAIAVP